IRGSRSGLCERGEDRRAERREVGERRPLLSPPFARWRLTHDQCPLLPLRQVEWQRQMLIPGVITHFLAKTRVRHHDGIRRSSRLGIFTQVAAILGTTGNQLELTIDGEIEAGGGGRRERY